MNKPKISIIVAITTNRGIGKNNGLLWHIPEELKRFREITTGHAIIMGRKTYESIGRPLPNRTNIVITRDPDFKAEGCLVVDSIEKAIEEAKKVEDSELFIIGGGQIYNASLKLADNLYITIVQGDFEPTVFFPEYEHIFTKKVSEGDIEADGEKDGTLQTFKIKFLELEKK